LLLDIQAGGGRTWWAHFEFTRINIGPTILRKKIEDLREARATLPNAMALRLARKSRLVRREGHDNRCALSGSSNHSTGMTSRTAGD
jgi:hypothetical protein